MFVVSYPFAIDQPASEHPLVATRPSTPAGKLTTLHTRVVHVTMIQCCCCCCCRRRCCCINKTTTWHQSDAAHETAVGEVRSELRLKSFELSQLGVAHAEKCSALRQVRKHTNNYFVCSTTNLEWIVFLLAGESTGYLEQAV